MFLTTGLPWFATIAVSTLLIRAALFPTVIKTTKTSTAIQKIKPQTEPLTVAIQKARNDGDMVKAQVFTVLADISFIAINYGFA